ncbi:integral membrane protein [Ilyonectria robusta]
MTASSYSEQSRSNTVIGVVVLCQFLATLITGLRLWTRRVILNQLGIDDCFAALTLVVTLLCSTFVLLEIQYGLGKHVSAVKTTDLPKFRKMFYFSIMFYNLSMVFVKLTFLFQYYRVLATQEMRKIYIAVIAVVTGWTLSQVFVSIFGCWPISGFWDDSIGARCIPTQPYWYINAAGHILTDIVILVLPIPAISRLNLPRRQRYILMGIFCLGFFTVAISIIRTTHLGEQSDLTWDNVTSALWSVSELTSALVCACLATLRPFFSSYFPALAARFARSTGRYSRSQSWMGRENPRDFVSDEADRVSNQSERQLYRGGGSAPELQRPNTSYKVGHTWHTLEEMPGHR